jgi:Family of unknown function (DUF6527)
MRLTDPWFEAEFYGQCTDAGGFTLQGDKIEGAQGVMLWCPCGFNDPKYREPNGGRPHAIIVPFANPRNAPACPPNHGPQSRGDKNLRPRWQMSGSSLADLTVAPSVAVGDPECWHGFIQGGEVR